MVYVHIGSVLILPESMSQSLYCRRHIRRQYRNVSLTQGVYISTLPMCTYTMCYVIPILSPFLFIPSLYASFLKFIGFFIYLSPLIFIYTQCMFSVLMDDAVWSMQVLKGEEVVIEKIHRIFYLLVS